MSKNPNTTGGASPILITGLGAFGAAGRNCEELWESSRGGQSQALRRVFAGQHLPAYVAPEVALARPDAHLVRQAGRAAGLALAAAREAWESSSGAPGVRRMSSLAACAPQRRGPAKLFTPRFPAWRDCLLPRSKSTAALFPFQPRVLPGRRRCTPRGSFCGRVSSISFSREAWRLLSSIRSWKGCRRREFFREALRPFDEGRDGTVLGEGAAFVVMETPESAARRGARVHGQLLAAAVTCESHSRIRPTDDCDGLQRAIRATLPQLSSAGSPVDLIHLHGTGTKLNDQMESACIRTLFGPPKAQPLCWGTKGLTGHTLGASPCFQVILSLLAMRHSFLPGTANCTTQDPLCDIRLSVGNGAPLSIQKALCLTSGFWGKNSALLLGAPDL